MLIVLRRLARADRIVGDARACHDDVEIAYVCVLMDISPERYGASWGAIFWVYGQTVCSGAC